MHEDERTRELGPASQFMLSPEDRLRLYEVYQALTEKGYSPVRQIAHYLLTGEPAYITTHRNARGLISRLEREEVLEEMVRHYLDTALGHGLKE